MGTRSNVYRFPGTPAHAFIPHKNNYPAVRKLRVYIAAPYTIGDPIVNIREAVIAGDRILQLGHIPFIPHINALWHLISPHPPETWYEWDLRWLEQCDAVIRLPGESKGADGEVARAKQLGMPVYTLEGFIDAAKS
jgi:hypothetical protein